MKYTELQNIEAYLGVNLDKAIYSQIEKWILSISSYIDKETNHFPIVADLTQSKTRKYSGIGGTELIIDDISKDNIVSLTINDSEVTDFDIIHNNYSDAGDVLYCKGGIPKGVNNVVIEGYFGKFNQLPEDIEFVCTVLVAGIYNTSREKAKEVRSETIGRYSVTYSDPTQKADYKRAMEIISNNRKVKVF